MFWRSWTLSNAEPEDAALHLLAVRASVHVSSTRHETTCTAPPVCTPVPHELYSSGWLPFLYFSDSSSTDPTHPVATNILV